VKITFSPHCSVRAVESVDFKIHIFSGVGVQGGGILIHTFCGGGGEGGGGITELLFVHLERTCLKSTYCHILELIPEFSNMIRPNSVTSYLNCWEFLLYTRDPNWIPPEFKVVMSALSQSDCNKMLIYDKIERWLFAVMH
jgi:hypothetical protein